MPRLIDDLRASDARVEMPHFVPPDKQDAWEVLARCTSEILLSPELPVLLIDNVAEYYFTTDQEYWDLRYDFPNLAPPYPAFWCECRLVPKIHSKQCGDTDLSSLVPRGREGMLIHGLNPADCVFEDLPANTRWVLWCELFVDFGKRGITATGPHGSMFLCVDAEGAIIDTPWMQSYAAKEDEEIIKSYMTWLHPAFLAISFLHCKNVTVIDNDVPAPLAKRYRERHGVAPCHYKTLVIEPLKKILRHEGRSREVGLAKAMHICRGHFKDYREGRGLFGKYKQLVWMPSIVRGTRGKSAPAREIEVKL